MERRIPRIARGAPIRGSGARSHATPSAPTILLAMSVWIMSADATVVVMSTPEMSITT